MYIRSDKKAMTVNALRKGEFRVQLQVKPEFWRSETLLERKREKKKKQKENCPFSPTEITDSLESSQLYKVPQHPTSAPARPAVRASSIRRDVFRLFH